MSNANHFLNFLKKVCVKIYLTVILSGVVCAQAQQSNCDNSNFESGNFNNWTGGTGTPSGNSGNNPGGCCPIQINNFMNTGALVAPRHTIISGAVTDPNTLNNLVEVAPGGLYSARLGSWQNSFYAAQNAGPFPGSKSERLNYSLTVTPNSDLFVYKYAVVLEDPDTIATQHTTAQKPRFEISVLDALGNYVPNALCGHYLVIADSNISGFQQGVVTTSSIIHYRDWTTVGIDLSNYIGQTITIQFQVGDCALGGHFGYAYIDAYCAPLGVLAQYCVGQNSVTLSAPEGFEYLWMPGADTTQTITVNNPVDGSVYTCQLTSVTGCVATIAATVHPTTVTPDFGYNVDCLDTTVTLFDSTQIQFGTITNWQWDFGDGSPLVSGIQNPVHTYPAPGTYNVTLYITTDAGCTTQITKQITIPVVTVNVPSSTMCSGSSVLLTASGVVSYQWSPSAGLNASTGASVVASPTSTTTYTVTGFNANGCSGKATSVVIINPNPVITATASDDSLCGTHNITLTATGGTTYSWSPSTFLSSTTGGTITATPTSSITYTVTAASVVGCTSQANVSVMVIAAVIISSTSGNICTGQSATLTASGANSFAWSNGTSGNSISVSPVATTSYSVIGTTGVCSDTSTSNVIVNPLPILNLTSTGNAICIGNSIALNASGATTYSWSPSTGLSATTGASVTASPTSSTTYTVTGVNATGCSATSTILVNVNLLPIISGTNSTICAGNSSTLSASGANTYTWSPNTNLSATTGASITANPNSTTTYIITGTDLNGCSSTANSIVTVNPLPTIISSQGNFICVSGSVALTASGATTYSWSPSTSLSATTGVTVTANPTATTTYTVDGTDANGCSASSTSIVNVNPLPVLVSSPPATICFSDSSVLTVTGAMNYLWSPSTGLSATTGTSVTASPASSTTYTIIGTNGSSCTASTTISITVNPLPIISTTPSSTSICFSSSATLSASGATNYLWSPSTSLSSSTGNSVTANPNSSTTYTVTGTDVNGCTASTPVSIIVNPLPIISITSTNPILCLGTSTSLSVTGASTYIWSPNTNLNSTSGATVIATPTSSITYTVDAIDVNGCTASSVSTVVVNPLPVISVSAPDTICVNTSTNLTASGATNYLWSPSSSLNSSTGNSVTASPTANTTYNIVGTDVNGCSASNSIPVKVNPLPSVSASSSSNAICFSSSATLSASGAVNYLWSPSTSLSSSTGNSVTANPNSSTTYTVTGTDVNGCTASTPVSIIVNPLPVISITSTNPILCLGTSTSLSVTGASTYTWSPNANLNSTTGATVIATPTSSITYTVDAIDVNGCMASSISPVVVNPLPVISVSAPDTICMNTSTTLTASGATNYLWSPSASLNSSTGNSVTASPISNTTYTIVGTDVNGCSASNSIPVKVNPLPSVSATSSTTSICFSSSATLSASGATNYLWSPSTSLSSSTGNSVTANPNSSTTYTVTGTDVNGCTAATPISIIVNPLPIISITSSNPILCLGGSTSLTASGANTYTWSPNTNLNSTTGATVIATPTSSITYTVDAIDVNGCMASSISPVVVNPLPTIVLTSVDSILCLNQSTTLNAAGALSYIWSPSTGLNSSTGNSVSCSPTASITYTVVGTNAFGCSSQNIIPVIVNSLPPVTVTNNPSICPGAFATLTATGALNYHWSTNALGNSISVNPLVTTAYTVIGTDVNGCTATDTGVVTLFIPPTISATALQNVFCYGASTTLNASGAINYLWSPATGLSATTGSVLTANPTSSSTYTIIGTDNNGCKDTTTLPITINPLPVAATGPDENLCAGFSVQLNASGGVTYLWSPSSSLSSSTVSNPIANPVATSAYIVVVGNQFGCYTQDTLNVIVHPKPIADAGLAQVVCFPDSIFLHGTGSDFYLWTPSLYLNDSSLQNPKCTPLNNITYTLTVSDSFNCKATDTVSVKLMRPFQITAAPGALICRNDEIQLNAWGGNNYAWTPTIGLDNPNIPNPIASPSYSTTYTVFSTDGICFTSTDSAIVKVQQLPIIYAGADVFNMYGQTYQLNGYSNGGTIQWTPSTFLNCTDCIDPIASHVNIPIQYTLTVTDSFGCKAEDSVYINLYCSDDLLYIPDAFTPNGDNKNDVFRIRTYGISHLTAFRVFNRWGEMVFETNDVNDGWDGTWQGQLCTPAVYVWYFEGTCANGFTLTKKGNVTLIR